MEHVGADDEVERAGFESLLGARFFEIENLRLDLGKGRELLHRAGEERRGDIGERVGVQAALEQRQHLRGEAASAGADFEDAQSAAFRESARGFLHRRADGREPVAGEQAVAVELIEQFRARAGEEHLHGVLFAAQDRAEFGAIRGARAAPPADGRNVAQMKWRIGFRCGVGRGVANAGSRRVAASRSFATSPRFASFAIKLLEDRLHRRGDAQRLRRELRRRQRRPFRASRARAVRR